uniref:Leucine-rich repeat-containing N-terminal plant-type domain-containing protein n=1 Tax=Lactuca sativa TaxID=4236 RepID=A0A9R1W461_LACSA|nr:hypothetical protein LSAT_V11C300107930 [Lactuca sativa]
MLSSWISSDCCRWERIHCDAITGNVKSLHLRGNNDDSEGGHYLVGNEVNSSLAELRHLKYLDLSGNDVGGIRIPEFIGSLKQLWYLNLSRSFFHGIVPPQIRNLSNLKVLDLSENYELMIDDMAWTFGLSSLEQLDLSFNDLSRAQNWDMVLYMIPSLKKLSLSSCGLSNVDIRLSLNSSKILPNIRHLDLGFNSFKGPLPPFLQNMTSLAFLDLSGFNISLAWNFANLLSMIPYLSELHLSSCELNKTFLSSRHLNFSTLSNIQHLDLRFSSIGFMFPSVLTNISSLSVLDLSGNRLNSSVPIMPNLTENLTNLKVLRLHNNNFTGGIPPSLCKASSLQILDLAHNNLMGPIPRCLGELNAMAEPIPLLTYTDTDIINLNENLIQAMKDSIQNMTQLFSLHLSRNELTGVIPQSMAALNFLSHLNLSHNNFSGRIPTGNQLQTLIDPSIYAGNEDLFGPPLPKNCSNHQDPITHEPTKIHPDKDKADDEPKEAWLFGLDIIRGFATGFWGIVEVLLFKKHWRMKLFLFVEETMDKIHVAVAIGVAKMKRCHVDPLGCK